MLINGQNGGERKNILKEISQTDFSHSLGRKRHKRFVLTPSSLRYEPDSGRGVLWTAKELGIPRLSA